MHNQSNQNHVVLILNCFTALFIIIKGIKILRWNALIGLLWAHRACSVTSCNAVLAACLNVQPMRAGAKLGQYTPLVPVLDGLNVRFTAISFLGVSYRSSSIGIKLSFVGQLAQM